MLLQENEYEATGLKICKLFGLHSEALIFYAKKGCANEPLMHIGMDGNIDRELLDTAIQSWEKFNGNIRKNPALSDGLKNISKFAPEKIPEHPKAKDITGNFAEAGSLYEKNVDTDNAVRYYETAKMYKDALRIYSQSGDREGMSRIYEIEGNLEEALNNAINPERKTNLLIRTERFSEA